MPGSSGDHDSKFSGAHDEYPTPPCYISARSADVILSDIRPTKLSPEALSSINALLDELLQTILSAARALTTTQLRAGLHKILPTTLGKEAVLEAEMELRAYWERTGGAPGSGSSQVIVDDSTFNLGWICELLRLKCEAYSTLSDTDENSEAETRLAQRMNAEGVPAPKQSLLAPASLYLTAIIESICEHILSNVGRVAARDSSRTTANSHDLFTALCEDSSIYGLFKNMAVYRQIETLSEMPRLRRSMSGAPETGSFRRNGSVHGSRPRMSSESHSTPVAISNPQTAGPSVEKSRAVKMFNTKASQDLTNGSESQVAHQKMDSFASANTKQSKGDRSPVSPTFSEDTRSQEFDDMMRSGSTMKVSLTPDRLRTMEVLNKEKARANARQKMAAKSEKSNGTETPPSIISPEQVRRGGQPTPTVRRVGSTIGNEEDRAAQKPPPTSRPRQLSAATASGYTVPSFNRVRASSTSDPSTALSSMFSPKQHPLSKSNPVPDQRPASGSIPRRKAPQLELDLNASRLPRTRTVARNRESLDLDDVMGDSDDEAIRGLKPSVPTQQHARRRGLSANTRELIEFLAEGPPETSNEDSLFSLSPTHKKSGRLQKMISKITLTSGNDSSKSPRKMTFGSSDAPSKSMTNLSPLANRPIPPRYVTSRPPSSSSSERGSGDQEAPGTRQRAQSYIQQPELAWDGKGVEEEAPSPSVPSLSPGMEAIPPRTKSPVLVASQKASEHDLGQLVQHPRPPLPSQTSVTSPTTYTYIRASASDAPPTPSVQPMPSPPPPIVLQRVSSKTSSPFPRKLLPPPASQASSSTIEHAREMRAMLERATSADECRILVDMFLTRSKLVADMAELALAATPSPPDSGTKELEKAIVGLFLGDSDLDIEHKPSLNPRAEPAEKQLTTADSSPSTTLSNRADSSDSG